MTKPKVYVHRMADWYGKYMDAENEALLDSFADVVSERDRAEPMTEDELVERMRGARVLLSLNGTGCSEITADTLRRVGTIEMICISHWWEQLYEAAAAAGIPFIEGSNGNTVAVAEWVLTCALLGVRKLIRFNDALKSGDPWVRDRYFAGMMSERTVGIVAYGRVGRYTAHYFKMMGAKVLVCDAFMSAKEAEEQGVMLVSMDTCFSAADILSIHLPVLPSTRGIIGAKHFAMIPDGAVFINSARAAVYDESELISELEKNRFSAYLDVFAEEPLAPDHPFRSMDNVFITPHIAGDNMDMFRRCGREAILTIRDYFMKKEVIDRKFYTPPMH